MTEFVTEEMVEKALDYLRDNAAISAQARANRLYLEKYEKVVKSQLMQECPTLAVNAQEREAYAHPRYMAHLEAYKEAIRLDEEHGFLLEAAKAKIDAWRTQQATERSMKL